MIERLYSHSIYSRDGLGIIGVREPNNAEIVDKINEIIDVVNQLCEQMQKGAENDRS